MLHKVRGTCILERRRSQDGCRGRRCTAGLEYQANLFIFGHCYTHYASTNALENVIFRRENSKIIWKGALLPSQIPPPHTPNSKCLDAYECTPAAKILATPTFPNDVNERQRERSRLFLLLPIVSMMKAGEISEIHLTHSTQRLVASRVIPPLV